MLSMSRRDPLSRRRMLSLTGAALALPAATLLTAGASARRPVTAAPADPAVAWAPELVTVSGPGFPVPYGHYVVAPNPAEEQTLLAAQRSVRYALPPGVGSERGLQVKTILAKRAISAAFPEIRDIGGMRADSLHWHPDGLAIDVMIPNYFTPEGRELGDRVAEFAYMNAERFGIIHIIWQQTFFPIDGAPPNLMPNLGSVDANHYTHVHIATQGGGYPTGMESYFG